MSELRGNELRRFFRPRNIALIGASDRSPWSRSIHSRFAHYGHVGALFAVNSLGQSAHGLPGFRSCGEIGAPVDMAYVFVPATAVVDALADAAAAGIRNAVVLTSGFAEAGPEGQKLQDDLVALARSTGMRIMGPNSLGFANIARRAVTTSLPALLPIRQGRLAIISQSGMIASELAKFALTQAIGVSFLAATGNEADIGVTDVLDYLIDDAATGAVALYVESIRDPAGFRRVAARAFAARKPIVMLKLGRSAISGAIAQAHTGSLVGDDGVFDAMCGRYAIVRVSAIEEMIVTASLLERIGPIAPPRIGMVSHSGGACAMYADLADLHGLAIEQYGDAVQAELREILPPFAATLNPLDVTAVTVQDSTIWSRAIVAARRDPAIGLVVAMSVLPHQPSGPDALGINLPAIVAGFRAAGAPALIADMSLYETGERTAALWAEAGVTATLPGIDLAVRALAHLQRWSERIVAAPPAGTVAARAEARPVGERETLAFLAARGVPVIPTTLARDGAAAEAAVRTMGGSAALKIASPDIAHKTEAGGVRLNVGAADAAATFETIMAAARAYAPVARLGGVLVSPMRDAGTELIVGVVRDADWGLATTVGIGGVLTELLGDTAIRLLPIDAASAREMLLSLRGARLLQGYRGAPPADLDRLAGVVVAIGAAATALGPDLAALEVNPLRVSGARIEALDGLTVYVRDGRKPTSGGSIA